MNANYDLVTDVAVLGAGPGGCATSLFLSQLGVRHIVFDKAVFPRDKVCGDAVSGKALAILKKINPGLPGEMAARPEAFTPSWGVSFVASSGVKVEIPFKLDRKGLEHPVGFVCKRIDFDHLIFQKLPSPYATVMAGTAVTDLVYDEGGVVLNYKNGSSQGACFAKVVVGAEGDRSIVAKKFAGHQMNPDHYCAALRAYYKNVSGVHPENFIELFYIEDLNPGYFWIFPLPNNTVNVGLGMLSSHVRKKHLQLKNVLLKLVKEHPILKERFKNAEPIDDIRGWGIPMGSQQRNISGDRFLLVGDAASLVDPFSGEGVGNAMVSGMHAAQVLSEALGRKDLSAAALKEYDRRVFGEIGSELKLSYALQRLVRFPWLFNFVVHRAATNKTLRDTITSMFDDMDLRAKLKSPLFYLRLLFNWNSKSAERKRLD